jgi:hypothetical protein
VLPWHQQPRLRVAGAALLAGPMIGGLVTLALGYESSPPAAIPERSDADAIASDHAAVATATATAAAPRPAATATPNPPPRPPHPHPGGGDDDDPGTS